LKSQFTVPSDHPSLVGHFPGNPIVPGVVILDKIIQAITNDWSEKVVSSISFVKFIKPLQADQKVTLNVTEKDSTTLKFVCEYNGNILVSGQCKVTDKDTT